MMNIFASISPQLNSTRLDSALSLSLFAKDIFIAIVVVVVVVV